MSTELYFRAMGSRAHVIVVGGDTDLPVVMRRRIDELEQKWSRFLPDSEVSALNRNGGAPLSVSADTVALVVAAKDAWQLSAGLVDATVLGAMVRAGYDRSFELLGDERRDAPWSILRQGCPEIVVSGHEVTLPPGVGFDPGGVGKGLAADIVVREALAAGARGACVNLGGDLRVAGEAPDGGEWTVEIEAPASTASLASVAVADGAVATSTTTRRRWRIGDAERHHLIDPVSGQPAVTNLVQVSVIDASAWRAEVLAKAVLLRGGVHAFDIVGGTGAQAVAVGDDGAIRVTAGVGGSPERALSVV